MHPLPILNKTLTTIQCVSKGRAGQGCPQPCPATQPCPAQPSPARRADMASYIGLRLDEPDIVVTVQVVYRGQYPHSSPEFLNPAPTGRATALLPPPLPAPRCATPTLPCCTAGVGSYKLQLLKVLFLRRSSDPQTLV